MGRPKEADYILKHNVLFAQAGLEISEIWWELKSEVRKREKKPQS